MWAHLWRHWLLVFLVWENVKYIFSISGCVCVSHWRSLSVSMLMWWRGCQPYSGCVWTRKTNLLMAFTEWWTGQGPCRANLHKWGLDQSPSCDCGQRQTMNHIVDTCRLTKFEGGLNLLHETDDGTVIWLESTVTAALAKLIQSNVLWGSLQCFDTVGWAAGRASSL